MPNENPRSFQRRRPQLNFTRHTFHVTARERVSDAASELCGLTSALGLAAKWRVQPTTTTTGHWSTQFGRCAEWKHKFAVRARQNCEFERNAHVSPDVHVNPVV